MSRTSAIFDWILDSGKIWLECKNFFAGIPADRICGNMSLA
ncbi:MAG: hypothetical protein OXC46_06505 [Thaumarchaeota archaeon]|nr:hypothetical protein [Nitrososphaerota archaeon]